MPTTPSHDQSNDPRSWRAGPASPLPVLPFRCLACEQVVYVDDEAAIAHFSGRCAGDLAAVGGGALPTSSAVTADLAFHEGFAQGFKNGLRLLGLRARQADHQLATFSRNEVDEMRLASLLAEALEFGSAMGQPLNGPGWPHLRAAKLLELLALATGPSEGEAAPGPASAACALAALGECRNILATIGKPVAWLDDVLAAARQVSAPGAPGG